MAEDIARLSAVLAERMRELRADHPVADQALKQPVGFMRALEISESNPIRRRGASR